MPKPLLINQIALRINSLCFFPLCRVLAASPVSWPFRSPLERLLARVRRSAKVGVWVGWDLLGKTGGIIHGRGTFSN